MSRIYCLLVEVSSEGMCLEGGGGARGGAGSNPETQTPPSPAPPPDPPKFSNLSLSKLRFLGKLVVPQAPNNFFRAHGMVYNCSSPLCVYIQILSSYWGFQEECIVC